MELPRPNLTNFDAVFLQKTAVHIDSEEGFFLGGPIFTFCGLLRSIFQSLRSFSKNAGGFPKMRGDFICA